MVAEELRELIQQIQERGCEEQSIEVKAAHIDCPKKLYDTISAFANQNIGGTLVFGLDEQANFAKVGVYDAQDLQKKVMEYCEQMTPKYARYLRFMKRMDWCLCLPRYLQWI